MKHPYPPFAAIERALTEVILEARSKTVRLKNAEMIPTTDEWDRPIEVWFFYEHDADVQAYKQDGTNEWIEKKFIKELNAAKTSFRFSEMPKIAFGFDSAENVEKNYQGSYYLRFK